MSRKKSIFLVMSFSFLVFYVVYSAIDYTGSALYYFDSYVAKRTLSLVHYAKIGDSLLKYSDEKSYQMILEDALRQKNIDFFIVKKDGDTLFYDSLDKDLSKIDKDYNRFNEVLYYDDVAYTTIRRDAYTVTLGFLKSYTNYFSYILKDDYGMILRDIFVVIAFFFVIIAIYFRDFLQLIHVLRDSKGRKFDGFKAKTFESDFLISSLRVFQEKQAALASENVRYLNQLLPSIQTELRSGRKPPYQFQCTLVRTDVNNFSTIFNSYPVEDVMTFINRYFVEALDVISRYGGYLHETIGDEIIYYFKDEKLFDSVPRAMACLRDLNDLAERLNSANKTGFHFAIKSAVVSGNLRYGPLLKGFGLAGGILIESARILSLIEDRDHNVIYYGRNIATNSKSVCESRLEKTVALKGLPGEYPIYAIEKYFKIDSTDLSNFRSDSIKYLRNDDAIKKLLTKLSQQFIQMDEKKVLAVFSGFREFFISQTSTEIKSAYCELVDKLLLSSTSGSEKDHVLASAVAAGAHLLSANSYDAEIKSLLTRLLKHTHARTVANTIDLISHFESYEKNRIDIQIPEVENNRTFANSIIKNGKLELNREVIANLKKMLTSKEPMYLASGLYAYAALFKHYLTADPIYLKAHSDFCELVKYAHQYIGHESEYVRAQAKRAISISLQINEPAA